MKSSGFTLIEMLAVLVLVSILAAVVLPRLSFGPDLEQRFNADRLVSLLRQTQLRAMNDPNAFTVNQPLTQCGRLVITEERFGIAQNCNNTLVDSYPEDGPFSGSNLVQTIGATHTLPLIIQFGNNDAGSLLSEDAWLGRPYIEQDYIEQDGSLNRLAAPLDISLGGVTVRIETEGYIHALP